jgi:hypothetical protein
MYGRIKAIRSCADSSSMPAVGVNYWFEIPTLAKNARLVHPQSW